MTFNTDNKLMVNLIKEKLLEIEKKVFIFC